MGRGDEPHQGVRHEGKRDRAPVSLVIKIDHYPGVAGALQHKVESAGAT
jgi:hypothetical protein